MKAGARLVLLVALSLLAADSFAQEITFTTTAANLVASKATIEMPGLAGNLQAVIVATPLGDTATLNPHPIGAWYYNGKWNIFNADHATMPAGLRFKVRVFLKPDANQFVHVMTKENLSDGVSFIDHPALNGNPDARFAIFQNHAPDNRPGYLNRYEARAEYDTSAGRWFIKNVGGERLYPNTAYNIVVSPRADGPAAGDTPPGLPKLSVTIPELVVKPGGDGGADPPCTCAIPIQTFFKTPPDNSHGIMPGATFPLIELTHQIVLGKRSRLIISGMIDLWGENCNACTKTSGGTFLVVINGAARFSLYIAVVPRIVIGAAISNFMIDLDPGVYNVEFKVENPASALTVRAKHSSIMTIPLG